MATGTRFKLSSSTNGRPIQITATATPGTPIHTADASDNDEVDLVAYNGDTSARQVTLEWGATGIGSELGPVEIPPLSWFPIAAGLHIEGGASIAAYADAANVVKIAGKVNRIQN